MSDDKYPDMSAMYSVMFAAEDKLKEEIEKLKQELDRTRKALDCAINTLDTVYGLSEDNSNIETYIKCKRIEINGIIKGGKDE